MEKTSRDRIVLLHVVGNRLQRTVRVPFDMIEGEEGRECWIRYRGGRLFVRRKAGQPWQAFRFEPKHGNAWSVA